MCTFPIAMRCAVPPNWRQNYSIKASKQNSVEWSKQNSVEIKSLQPPFAMTLSSWLICWLVRERHQVLMELKEQSWSTGWLLRTYFQEYVLFLIFYLKKPHGLIVMSDAPSNVFSQNPTCRLDSKLWGSSKTSSLKDDCYLRLGPQQAYQSHLGFLPSAAYCCIRQHEFQNMPYLWRRMLRNILWGRMGACAICCFFR